MFIIKISAIAFVTAVITIYLKKYSPETGIFASIAGGIIILFLIIDYLYGVVDKFELFFIDTGLQPEVIKILFKVILVAYLVEFTAGVVRDLGEQGLSDKVLLAGKIVVLVISLPIVKSLFALITEIISV